MDKERKGLKSNLKAEASPILNGNQQKGAHKIPGKSPLRQLKLILPENNNKPSTQAVAPNEPVVEPKKEDSLPLPSEVVRSEYPKLTLNRTESEAEVQESLELRKLINPIILETIMDPTIESLLINPRLKRYILEEKQEIASRERMDFHRMDSPLKDRSSSLTKDKFNNALVQNGFHKSE